MTLPALLRGDALPAEHTQLRLVEALPTASRGATAKRCLDVSVAVGMLLVLTPLLLALVLLVAATSRGPVLYRQVRVGRHGQRFTLLKFRSMRAGADQEVERLAGLNQAEGPLFKIHDDPRVTAVGRWMRRLSLDELPQLLNVIGGSMSLVGPRPALPDEVAQFDAHVHRRHLVKPGLTGLWQVSGRSNLDWDEGVRLDLFYVEHHSLWLDLRILLRTVPAVLAARGAY